MRLVRASASAASTSGRESPSASADAADRFVLLQRQLSHAVDDEDYSMAAKLRDECKALLASLPPVTQYVYHQVSRLRMAATVEDRLEAIEALGEVGDDGAAGELARCLGDPALQEAAQAAMWAIFMRSRDPAVSEKLNDALRLMQQSPMYYQRALDTLEEVIKLAPTFAEGYNKRATLYYMMQRYQESIDDCKTVLQLQPHHFGAASGMGLCYVQLGRLEEAIPAFRLALQIHPGLTNIQRLMEDMKRQVLSKKFAEEARAQPEKEGEA